MSKINVRKKGDVYQYYFETAKINGNRSRVYKSGFKTKGEALKEGAIAYSDYLNTGVEFKETDISFNDYLDYWLKNYCESNLKYNTIQTYETIIVKYLKPYLGKYRLSAITSVTLNNYIYSICNRYDFSRVYFANILKVLKGCFREACDVYGLIRYNPTLTLRLPRIDKYIEDVKHVYSQSEIDCILDRFKDNETFTCAFLTSCFTGMRTGEVFALTWDDIDLDKRIISIKHNVYDKVKDNKGRWFIGSTKTINGIRKVYIGDTLLKALINYKNRQEKLKKTFGNMYQYYHLEPVTNTFGKTVEYRIVKSKTVRNDNLNLVFTKNDGEYSATDITKYPFKIIHTELGIKKCRFYDLRGSYATKILNQGIEIRNVADILGHKNIETTENYYISSSEDSRKKAYNVLEGIVKSDVIEEIINYNK
jgi:integrase